MAWLDGVQRVEVYNEGLAVFLHDPANAAAIVAADPPSLFCHDGTEPSRDKKLRQVVEAGWLVVYTLQQDDAVTLDVVVGPPLSKAALKAAPVPLLKPQQAVLSVPSGTLRVDSANTWELGGETAIEDSPGLLQVPPGEYVVTLYRVDRSAPLEEHAAATDLLVLTPAEQAARPKKIPAVLEYGTGYAQIAGLRSCRIVDGEFRGIGLGAGSSNLQPRHAAALGLQRGQVLRIEHEGTTHRAVYLAGADPTSRRELFERLYPDRLQDLHRQDRELLTAAFLQSDLLPVWLLHLGSLRPNVSLTGQRGSPVLVTPTAEFVLPAPSGPVPQGEFADQAITGTVLTAGRSGLDLGCSTAVLRHLARERAAILELEVAGQRVPVVVCTTPEQITRPTHIVATLRRSDRDLAGDVRATMANGGDALFVAMVGARAAELIETIHRGGDPAEIVAIWRAGVGRFAGPDALAAAARPHWDDPAAGTLTLQPVAWPPDCPFADCTGMTYRLTRWLD